MASNSVVIIGAGLIGLSLAFELAGRGDGTRVRLFDKGEPGKAASWAGAGMLAPHTEDIADNALRALCIRSLQMYADFVHAVEGESGLDARFQPDGILTVAYDSETFGQLHERAERLRSSGASCEVFDRNETLVHEPALGKRVAGSLFVREEGQVDNRRLGRALFTACTARNVTIETNVASLTIEHNGRSVLGVRTDRGFTPADVVVNAAGAWAKEIAGVPPNCVPEVEPVKGQMLTIEIPRGLVQHVVWVPGAYVVPRSDGRLLVGATVEQKGYDTRVTASGIHALLHAALDAVPALTDFTVSETWAGLRPGTPNGRPFLGATPLGGYFLATGHYRNGILLAPITAKLIADAIEGKGSEPAFSNLVA